LRASCVLLGRVEPFAHVFGDQVVAISIDFDLAIF
jgi:hypothetical protein